VLLGWVWSGIFKEKLGSIVNGIARISPFCHQSEIVFIETLQRWAILEMVSIPRSRSRSKRFFNA